MFEKLIGGRNEKERRSGNYQRMNFTPRAFEDVAFRYVGKTKPNEFGRTRSIYETKERNRELFYGSDQTQWAVYELLGDFLEINPVIYTKEHGFLSWKIPPEMYAKDDEAPHVGADILAFVMNDYDHSVSPLQNAVIHHETGQIALYDTEQALAFWNTQQPDVLDRHMSRIQAKGPEYRRTLNQKVQELYAFYASPEGEKRIEDIFSGRHRSGEAVAPASDPFSNGEDEHTPQSFRQEFLARLKKLLERTTAQEKLKQ